jgi:hypothetical protein
LLKGKKKYHSLKRSGGFERAFEPPDSVDEERSRKPILIEERSGVVVAKRPEAVKAEEKIPISKASARLEPVGRRRTAFVDLFVHRPETTVAWKGDGHEGFDCRDGSFVSDDFDRHRTGTSCP